MEIAFDADNPEWTEADFQRARPAHEVLPEQVLKAFPKTRGPQAAPKKIPVSIRLSPEVVERFKAQGPGWQTRIDDILKKAVGL
ncbi:BrnA antitoxin family protein [Devosia honganensis]|uniref:BrnA antitoxin family protein n=1 Tax=Devosia honganensis TaxID=1610527 RepID=A0ABV7WWL6_9HYPH